jgi:hypothetical protein
MTQTDVPSTSAIRVFSTRPGSTLMASDNNSYCGHLEMKELRVGSGVPPGISKAHRKRKTDRRVL